MSNIHRRTWHYMMPACFGPQPGPRQRPDGGRWPSPDDRRSEVCKVRYRVEPGRHGLLLPTGVTLAQQPVVTVRAAYITNIAWLAGRGYNTLGVSIPVDYHGEHDDVSGELLLVLWENLCDPILTGRDQLGYAKIWAELPLPTKTDGEITCEAFWMGHRFFRMVLSELSPAPGRGAVVNSKMKSTGLLHYRYVPAVGQLDRAAVHEMTFTPVHEVKVVERHLGNGEVHFEPTSWADMPTQSHIVETLRNLNPVEFLEGSYEIIEGGHDLIDQVVLS